MAINHQKIRDTLQIIGILAFLVMVGIQLRRLFLYGGKTPPKTRDGEVDDMYPIPEETEPAIASSDDDDE